MLTTGITIHFKGISVWRDRSALVTLWFQCAVYKSIYLLTHTYLHTDLIKPMNLQLFGHICRMKDERLVKTVMLGMVQGDWARGPRGKPARRRSDDMTEVVRLYTARGCPTGIGREDLERNEWMHEWMNEWKNE